MAADTGTLILWAFVMSIINAIALLGLLITNRTRYRDAITELHLSRQESQRLREGLEALARRIEDSQAGLRQAMLALDRSLATLEAEMRSLRDRVR